jgi:hypothetical protein
MNNWYAAGMLAAEHRADLEREAAADELRRVAKSARERGPSGHLPRSGGLRREPERRAPALRGHHLRLVHRHR